MPFNFDRMKRTFGIHLSLVGAALLGLLAVQYYWIDQALQLRNEELTARVNQQLITTAAEIESNFYCFTYFSELELNQGETLVALLNKGKDSIVGTTFDSDTLDLKYFDPHGKIDQQQSKFQFKLPTQVQVLYQFKFLNRTARKPQEALTPEEIWLDESYRNYVSDPDGVAYLVDSLLLDTLLVQSFQNASLGDSMHYAITRQSDHTVVYASKGADTATVLASTMQVALLANEPFNVPYRLWLYFPKGKQAIFYSQWPVLLSSAAVLVILIVLLLLFVRTLWREKQLADLKSDFVGNMSHEFKTPVSNINLALDTLDLKGSSELSSSSILDIIRQENNRLRDNLERVLNVSWIENRGLELHPTTTDIHEVIQPIVTAHSIQLRDLGGSISFQPNAHLPIIKVDQVHFGNVVSNLLDNAIKYSSPPVAIEITTHDFPEGLVLKVKDQGIGLSQEESRHIFDKFYRVPTGKVHNVKGFGLGLAYVKRVVVAHKGHIGVTSERDRGSEFTVTWPRT